MYYQSPGISSRGGGMDIHGDMGSPQQQFYSPPRTPVTSRDRRGDYERHSRGQTSQQQYSPQGSFAQQQQRVQLGGTPPRMDNMPYGVQNMQSNGLQQSGSTTSDQELVDHASKTIDRLMMPDRQVPSLYRSLVQVSDQNVAVAGIKIAVILISLQLLHLHNYVELRHQHVCFVFL